MSVESPEPLREAPGEAVAASGSLAIGLLLGGANVAIIATQPVMLRYGATHIDPLLFSALSVAVAAAFIAPILHWRGELIVLTQRQYRARLFSLSMAGTVATTLTLIIGFRRISAIAGVLLMQSEPIYSLALATLVIGERPSWRQLLATAAIIAGIGSVFAAGTSFNPAWAALLVLMTPAFWQTAHVLSLPVMPPLSPICITGARYIYAAVVLFGLMLVARPQALLQLRDPVTIAVILATGVVIYALGSLCWYAAISRLSLTFTTALVIPSVPLLSILFAIVFLGERVTRRESIGLVVAIDGVLALVLGSEGGRKHLPPEEALEAIHQPLA